MFSTVWCDVHIRGDWAKGRLPGLGGNDLVLPTQPGGLEGFEDSSSEAQREEEEA